MQTDEIIAMTREHVAKLVHARRSQAAKPKLFKGDEQRADIRWPFPGAVEIWPAGGDGRECWLATCLNLGYGGLGMLADDPFPSNTPIEFACHLPEASFYGKAIVRHCTELPDGYHIGIEFDFDS